MSKRYYLCTIIGDGSEEEPFRPAVASLDVSWVSLDKPNPEGGPPLLPWALVLVATANHAACQAISGVDALPDFPLDARMSAMSAAARTDMLDALAARGISTAALSLSDGYRELINSIGNLLQPGFSVENFDVQE